MAINIINPTTALLSKIDQDIADNREDTLRAYRPKTVTEVVEKTGDIISDGVTAMFRRVAEQVRAEAQNAVDQAVRAQQEADKLAADIVQMGERHASSLLKAAERAKSLLELLDQQRSIFAPPPEQS